MIHTHSISENYLRLFSGMNRRTKLELISWLSNSLLEKDEDEITDWTQFSGIWNKEEADEISESIKDCEKVDLNEW